MREENIRFGDEEVEVKASGTTLFMRTSLKDVESMKEEVHDEDFTHMVERMTILRISTKHSNLWMRQLEMKRMEII